MGDQYLEVIPVLCEGKTIAWVDRQAIKYYNMHVRLPDNIFRVGEYTLDGSTVYVYDRSCVQWAEFTSVPHNNPPI